MTIYVIILHPSHHPQRDYKGSSSRGPHKTPTKRSQTIEGNFIMAQDRMKQQANRHCNEREFEVGDWIYLRLHSYNQMSLKHKNKESKLASRYYVPYKML